MKKIQSSGIRISIIAASLVVNTPAFCGTLVTGGGFEDGKTAQEQNVAGWFESSVADSSFSEWVNPASSIQADAGSGYVPSRHLAIRGNGWIYQSIGTYDSLRAPELDFRFYQGRFSDGNGSTGASVSFYTTDGRFVPDEGTDIQGATGVTQLGTAFTVSDAASGGTGYRTGIIDLAGLTDGTVIWMRFSGSGTASQYAAFDDISVFQPGGDSDGDGLSDEDEVNVYGTDFQKADTDGDGLSDGDEVNSRFTDPLHADTDGDLFSDGVEVHAATDPLDSTSFPAISGNGSIYLDGKSFLSFENTAGMVPSGNSPFTVELWANPVLVNTEPAGGSTFVFWGNEATRQANGFRLAAPSRLKHYFWSDDRTFDTGVDLANDQIGPIGNGWHHFAVTYDGAELTMYLDGNAVSTTTPTGMPNVTDANHLIGRKISDSFGAGYFNGYLDEIRIWNTARSASEIRGNFARSLEGNEAGLVAAWNFNGNLDDLTEYGGNLTPSGDVLLDSTTHAPLDMVTPLTIKAFSHDPVAGTSIINWSSSPASLYHVESSENMHDWSLLGEVQGDFIETSFTDHEATADRKFYRVRGN